MTTERVLRTKKIDERNERRQEKLTGGTKKMKKSIQKIERRTRGRVTSGNIRSLFENASNAIPDTMETLVAANDAEGRMAA